MRTRIRGEITSATVRLVRAKLGLVSNRGIGRELGIGRSTVDRIAKGLHVSERLGRADARCDCGALVDHGHGCPRCTALHFRRTVVMLQRALQALAASFSAAVTDPDLPIDRDLRQLIAAGAADPRIAGWLQELRDEPHRLRQLVAQVPDDDELESQFDAWGIAPSKLLRLGPLALQAVSPLITLSQDTSP